MFFIIVNKNTLKVFLEIRGGDQSNNTIHKIQSETIRLTYSSPATVGVILFKILTALKNFK